MTDAPKVRTCLALDDRCEEAAAFYTGLLPDSAVESVARPDPAAPALAVAFILAGAPCLALNAGGAFRHGPAASLLVSTGDQAETDRLWAALTADGGAEGRCGWLTDRFGVSWQIVPARLPEMMSAADGAAAARAQAAMMTMTKIDVAALEAAFAGP